MRDALTLGVYMLGWVCTARALFVWGSRHPDGEGQGQDGFVATVAGLIWPVLLFVAVVLAPIVAVGWLISRPVRRRKSPEAPTCTACRQAPGNDCPHFEAR